MCVVCMCVCECVCTRACVCESICVCVCMRVCVRLSVSIHILYRGQAEGGKRRSHQVGEKQTVPSEAGCSSSSEESA